jgi:hypothetical protein
MKTIHVILIIGAAILAAFFLRGFLKGLTSPPSDPFQTPDDFYYFVGF